MGAAAILRAVAVHGLRPDGLIVEAPFDRLVSTIGNRFTAMGLPATPFNHLLVMWGSLEIGANGFNHNPAEYAAQVHCPTLVLKVLDEPGLIAFRNAAAELLDEYLAGEQRAKEPLPPAATYTRRRWEAVLRTIFEHQGDVEAYLALCERTGTSPPDCLEIARLLHARQQPAEALTWVERGLKLDQKQPHRSGAEFDLMRLRRQLLLDLGRGQEALDEAWGRFQKHPSEYTYQELLDLVPASDRTAWHARAIDAVAGADLDSLIKLLLVANELARLADRIRHASDEELEDVSHFTTEPAAKALEADFPDLAARLHQSMGMRILNGGKSKYYDAAIGNFRDARRCYERAGQMTQWNATVARVRADHRRKVGFIADFEKVVAGAPQESSPSFLDRAKARWSSKDGS